MKNPKDPRGTCGCWLLLLLINLTVGGWSTQYIVDAWLHKSIPFFYAALIGVVGGELTIPAALITWLLKMGGVL